MNTIAIAATDQTHTTTNPMPTTTRRLYLVEATYQYFVVADDEYDALDCFVLSDAINDAIDPDSHTALLDDGTTNPGDWGAQCLVYSVNSDKKMTLEEARERLGGNTND